MSSIQTPLSANEATLRIFCEELHVPFVTDADALATSLAMAFGAAARDGQLHRLEQRLFDDVLLKSEFASRDNAAQFRSEMEANHFEGSVERVTPSRRIYPYRKYGDFINLQEVDVRLSGSGEVPSFASQEIVPQTVEISAQQEGALTDSFDTFAAALATLSRPEFEALRQLILREALQRELAKSDASPAALSGIAKSLRGITEATERRDDQPG